MKRYARKENNLYIEASPQLVAGSFNRSKYDDALFF